MNLELDNMNILLLMKWLEIEKKKSKVKEIFVIKKELKDYYQKKKLRKEYYNKITLQ